MKTPLFNLIKALLIFAIMFIATIYKFSRRHYRRFCIKVLWKKFTFVPRCIISGMTAVQKRCNSLSMQNTKLSTPQQSTSYE